MYGIYVITRNKSIIFSKIVPIDLNLNLISSVFLDPIDFEYAKF